MLRKVASLWLICNKSHSIIKHYIIRPDELQFSVIQYFRFKVGARNIKETETASRLVAGNPELGICSLSFQSQLETSVRLNVQQKETYAQIFLLKIGQQSCQPDL